MKKFFRLILSFTLSLALCIILAFVTHSWLGDSVFPVSDIYDSYEWADIFGVWYIVFTITMTTLNILFIIFHNSKTPQRKWFAMLVSDIIISSTSFIPLFLVYPLDGTVVYFICVCALALLTGPGVFFVSTLWAPWDFNPRRIG